MDVSTLKLVMEKGPRESEAFEYNSEPEFTIHIGRVIRGNTIAIRDKGISTKHLYIKTNSHGLWVVKDLDSSNGTLLNNSPLPPLTEKDLRDGDVLKFGEVTSIRVQISQFTDSQPEPAIGRKPATGARVSEIPVLEKDGGRITRSRAKKIDSSTSTCTSALERIPEAEKQITKPKRGRKKKVVETESAAEQIPTEQEHCNEMVKPEPQSDVDGIVSKDEHEHEHSSKESMSEIAQKVFALTAQLNQDPNAGVVNPQESKPLDLSKATVGELLEHLRIELPKQIILERDRVIQDMQTRSQQVREYVLQQQKDKGKAPLG